MLTDNQIERYSRHIILQEVGGRGQEALLGSSVALVGQGELIATAALYLAAAGVGSLALPREHIAYLHGLNDDVRLTAVEDFTVEALADMADVVICGAAPRATAAAVNAACVARGTPLLWGTAQGDVGSIALFASAGDDRPCLACLTALPAVPGARAAGTTFLAAPVASMVGSLLAGEAMKVVLGVGELRTGRLWVFAGHDAAMRDVTIPRDPACRVCAPSGGSSGR